MASPPAQEPPPPPPGSPPRQQQQQQPAAAAAEQAPGDVHKCGYLRKHKHGHKRFFVLREGGGGEARLEYYESEKKWRSKGAAPKRAIALEAGLQVHKRADAKHRHLLALYTRGEYLALAAESAAEQEAWFQALSRLLRAGRPAAEGACPLGPPPPPPPPLLQPPGPPAYREVWQVTLRAKGLGRPLAGVQRLCLAARTVALVRPNSPRPGVTLPLMTIRRCGHSDSFFFMELGRSAATGPGELWMQADDAVVAQHIHETVLGAMRALRELPEGRPRSKSQSSASSAGASSAAGSRPISVPARRPPPPGQAALLRRSRTHTPAPAAAAAGGGPGGSRARTASEGDGRPAGPPSPLSPSGALRPAPEPGLLAKRVSGSPSDPAAWGPLEDWGASPGAGPRPFPSSCSSSTTTTTPESPPGQPLDAYLAMAPRKRTCSLTTPARPRPWALPLASASLDEHTLRRAARAGPADPEDAPADLEVGSGGSRRRRSGAGGEEGYVAMSPGGGSAWRGPAGSSASVPMSPASVSAPQRILQPRPYKTSSESSPDDSGYLRMGGPGARLSGESPDGRLVNGDYSNMSPLLHESSPTASASPLPSPDGLGALGPGARSSGLCGRLAYAGRSRLNSLGEERDGDQYVQMNSLAGMLIQAPNGEPSTAPGNPLAMPLLLCHRQAERSLPQRPGLLSGGGVPPSRRSWGTLLPGRNEEPLPCKVQSSCGDYVSLGYSTAPAGGLCSFGSGLSGHPGSLSNYMNLKLNGAASVGSVKNVLSPGSSPCPRQPHEHSLKMAMEGACLSSPSSEVGDYAEMDFSPATTPPQPISHKPESPHVSSPMADLKRLKISGVEAFLFASPPPDPNHGAKVIRADPQGRRRHSSETFSSTTTVTPVSPSFAHVPKRHNSASVENVSLRKNEGFVEEQNSSPMCRETSAGFQNGLNYIAVDGEEDHLANGGPSKPQARPPLSGSISDAPVWTSWLTT